MTLLEGNQATVWSKFTFPLGNTNSHIKLCFLLSLVTAKTFGLYLLKNAIYTYSVFTYKQIRCSYVKEKSVAHHWPVSTVSVTFYYDVFADVLEYPESQCSFFYREPQMQSRICMYLCRYKSTSMYMIKGRRKLIILFACFVQIWNRTMKTCSPILVHELLAYWILNPIAVFSQQKLCLRDIALNQGDPLFLGGFLLFVFPYELGCKYFWNLGVIKALTLALTCSRYWSMPIWMEKK